MSEPPASYAFLPWLRRGIAGEIAHIDGTPAGSARAVLPVSVQVKAAGTTHELAVSLALFGPGEIGGIDPRIIIRTNPMPGEFDASPNLFPAVDFDQPDFPWRYTPARADSHARLRPWLVLAVVTPDEIVAETAADGGGKLAEITVASPTVLPRLNQSWAWSHVQIDAFDPATENLQAVATESPERLRSRILAPRRLRPRTRYRALLLPSFERGRRAGLKEPLDESVDALLPAWGEADVEIRLPVYVSFDFQTGDQGDFESLARRLRARSAAASIGSRDMDVSVPDPALPGAAAAPLGMEGALVSPAATPSPWQEAEKAAFQTALAGVLNRPAGLLAGNEGNLRVAPPLWGQWHAARGRLEVDAEASPGWFHELNGDPRLRVAAGLGAEVVRRNDQQLMAEAWNQVAGVLEANGELRRAQMARAASEKLHRKHLLALEMDAFHEVTARLHSHVLHAALTVRETLRRSPLPPGVLDGQMRRLRRPGGAVGRRLQRLRRSSRHKPLVTRLNSGDLRLRRATPAPVGAATVSRIDAPLDRRWEGLKPGPDFVPAASASKADLPVAPPNGSVDEAARKLAVARFREALGALVSDIEVPVIPGPRRVAVDLAELRDLLAERTDPRVTIPAGILDRLSLAEWIKRDFPDPLEPIMAAPYFDTPMYEPLRDLSQSWLMPGVGGIAADTVTVVVSNQRFIEAYMAGLSHEMARELLYHEYPTDQRGTYFRQFWDARGALGDGVAPPDPETLRDIKPIHLWTEMLGDHSGRTPVPREGHIVLLIKGEVLRRYPATQVCAVKAVIDAAGERNLGTAALFPAFEGRLDPDISFFGFDLLPAEVCGDSVADPGWYFVLQEQPTEPTFGLDADVGSFGVPVASWSDLGWAHLAADAAALDGLGYIDLDAALPDTSQLVPPPGEPSLAWHATTEGFGDAGANASDLASITLRRPFRVAIHGSEMLPSEPA